VLDRIPRDVSLAQLGPGDAQRAQLALWARQPDEVVRLVAEARQTVFDGQRFFSPVLLYAAWAQALRHDKAAAQADYQSALTIIDAALSTLPDDWRLRAARGAALAGLASRGDALREAEWLRQSAIYREDALDGPLAAEARAHILADTGDAAGAIDEIERLLARPSLVSVQTLRLDPRWDPIREHPRFMALMAR
jgi:serine/threonine-protein kinase